METDKLAVVKTTTNKKVCKCCGKTLPLDMFKKQGVGYANTCFNCKREKEGISEKFANFTSRELIEELRSRGYQGTLRYVRIEEIKI